MKFLILLPIYFFHFSVAQTAPSIAEKSLTDCYGKYRFFQSALMEISDADFADSAKSRARKLSIKKAVDNNLAHVKVCLKYILEAADPKDVEGSNYVKFRMREISEVVAQAEQKNIPAPSTK